MENERAPTVRVKKTWVKPSVQALPKLTELTLQSGGVIPGGGDGGGGGIF